MAEMDLRKTQSDLEALTKIMKAQEGEVSKYRSYFQITNSEIKSLKEI